MKGYVTYSWFATAEHILTGGCRREDTSNIASAASKGISLTSQKFGAFFRSNRGGKGLQRPCRGASQVHPAHHCSSGPQGLTSTAPKQPLLLLLAQTQQPFLGRNSP